MVPISGRIEDDLYQWFISLRYEGAKTNSDKLREALKELKSQHDGAADMVAALSWFQNLSRPLRDGLARVDRDELAHSEVMSALIEHVAAMAAMLVSSRPQNREEAAQVEEQLVRRAFSMTEALLRQAVTPAAAAFEPAVVRKYGERTIELAKLINVATTGEKNG
jgi:hypothetical protein